MKNPIKLSDFTFTPNGYGQYTVEYTNPVTNKSWSRHTTNMPLIDKTKNADEPEQIELICLMNFCKGV